MPPVLKALLERVHDFGCSTCLGDIESLAPYVEAVLADESIPAAVVNAELRTLLEYPEYAPVARSGAIHLNPNDDNRSMRVLLSRTSGERAAKPKHAMSDPAHFLIGAFNAPIRVAEFAQQLQDDTVLNAGALLLEERTRTLEPKIAHVMPATLSVRSIFSDVSTWTLTVFQVPSISFIWQYDMETRRPVRLISAENAATRIEAALRLLSELGTASAPVLLELMEHPAHHIRWQSAATLAKLYEREGIVALETLTSDPHPHVRAAAARTIENYRNRRLSPLEGQRHGANT